MSRLYYILDTRSCVGNCGLWWGPNRSGYVCSLDEAGKYEEEEALRIQESRGTDAALPCDEVDNLAVRHVRVDTDAFWRLRYVARARPGTEAEE